LRLHRSREPPPILGCLSPAVDTNVMRGGDPAEVIEHDRYAIWVARAQFPRAMDLGRYPGALISSCSIWSCSCRARLRNEEAAAPDLSRMILTPHALPTPWCYPGDRRSSRKAQRSSALHRSGHTVPHWLHPGWPPPGRIDRERWHLQFWIFHVYPLTAPDNHGQGCALSPICRTATVLLTWVFSV